MPIYSRFQATSKFRKNVGRGKLFQMHFSNIPRVDLMHVCVGSKDTSMGSAIALPEFKSWLHPLGAL